MQLLLSIERQFIDDSSGQEAILTIKTSKVVMSTTPSSLLRRTTRAAAAAAIERSIALLPRGCVCLCERNQENECDCETTWHARQVPSSIRWTPTDKSFSRFRPKLNPNVFLALSRLTSTRSSFNSIFMAKSRKEEKKVKNFNCTGDEIFFTFSHHHIRIMGSIERLFELLELFFGENRSMSPFAFMILSHTRRGKEVLQSWIS